MRYKGPTGMQSSALLFFSGLDYTCIRDDAHRFFFFVWMCFFVLSRYVERLFDNSFVIVAFSEELFLTSLLARTNQKPLSEHADTSVCTCVSSSVFVLFFVAFHADNISLSKTYRQPGFTRPCVVFSFSCGSAKCTVEAEADPMMVTVVMMVREGAEKAATATRTVMPAAVLRTD